MVARKGVFETNSSSTHSFQLADKYEENCGNFKKKSGVLEIETGEFGWEQEHYFNWYAKLSYLITYMNTFDDIKEHEHYCKLLEVIQEVNPSITEIKVLDPEEGYIDHQSFEVPKEILGLTNEDLKKYLFGVNSYLITDNDNH